MTENKTKYEVVDCFPSPSRFFNNMSRNVSTNSYSSSDDESTESSDSFSTSSCSSFSSFSSDDDISPQKKRKISDTESSSSSDSSSSDSSSSGSSSSDSSSSGASLPDVSLPDASDVSEMDNYNYNYLTRPRLGDVMIGKRVDLTSYLSSKSRDFLVNKDGEKVSVKSGIEGKYVILIWLELPVDSWSFAGYMCWALRSACSTSSIWSTNVQVVVVPRAHPGCGWEENEKEQAFVSVLSGLPSCLAIPLWDSENSDAMRLYHNVDPHTIVFDPNQTVLREDCCWDINQFGADSYPFTDERFLTLRKTSLGLFREKPFPLEKLLGLDVSDCLSNVAGDAKIAVSELKQRLVGVFVTFHLGQFDRVHRAYQDCLAKGRKLEIVLACINLVNDPQYHMDSLYAALRGSDKGMGILSSWWLLPYNDSTHRRLWKLLDNLHHAEDERIEELIIVGPQGEFFDPQTLKAIPSDSSILDMYPYAIQPIAEQESARLQKLTLESLLISNHNDYLVTQHGNLMPVTELRGKNVLLFIADLQQGYKEIMAQMRDYWCPEIEDKCKVDSNTAVVFVPLHSSDLIFTKELDPRMFWLWDPTIPWLISPPNHVREALIIKALSLKGNTRLDQLSCVAFGDDGRFVSNDLYGLSEYMANDLHPDHLYRNVLKQYCCFFDKEFRESYLMGYDYS